MFKFFNKRERSVTGEQDVRRIDPIIQNKAESLLDFYKQNQELFQGYFDGEHNQQTKKTLIRDVYDTIGYTKPTQTTKPEKSSLQLYRGLRADTGTDILKYTEDFVKGEVVFGKKASLHGTGIYMTTNPDIANKYAQYDNSFGSVLSCQVKNDINIVNDDKLRELQGDVVQYLRDEYSTDQGIQQFTTLLDDNGLFAALSGFDAIDVPNREFVLLLNRDMVFVDEVAYYMAQEINDIVYTQETTEMSVDNNIETQTDDVELDINR